MHMVHLQIINYLRFGCTPVGVLDGEAPDEKLETLQARWDRVSGSSSLLAERVQVDHDCARGIYGPLS